MREASRLPSSPGVLRPADAPELEALVQDAAASRTPLRLAGAGTWLDAGRPVQASRTVALDRLRGVVEYVPGDLTLTARAGTPLAELQQVVAAEGQWLPLEPWGGDAGTLGATLATATAGPTSGALGLPRDVALGLSFVSGTGETVRAGGRVVKNVAGFDLVRLVIGAWGTLGAITEATVRLRARPEAEATVALALPSGAGVAEFDEWLRRLRALPLQPLALELVSASLCARLGLPAAPGGLLVARLAGNAAAVAAQRDTLALLADVADVPSGTWTALRVAEPAGAVTARVSAAPTRLGDCWRAALAVAAAFGTASDGDAPFVHASVQRGVARLVLPGAMAAPPELVRAAFAAERGATTRLFERLPAALWPVLAPSPATGRLAVGVRAAFDPQHLSNPGILGEAAVPATATAAAPMQVTT